MQKIFDHFKTNAGVWTFGLFMAAVAGGIYQFTTFMVSAQVTPVKVRIDAEVKRLDAADGNTNGSIARFEKFMSERFNQLEEGIGQNRERMDRLDEKIGRLGEKLDRKIALLDQKLDKKIDRLDEKMDKKFDLMDKKFDLILLRLPPLKK